MTYTCLSVTTLAQGIWQITLSRMEKLNALNATLINELTTVLQQAKQDANCLGLLFTGAGKAFCAGADINQLASVNALQGLAFAREGQALMRLIETLGKPCLAAINGFAFGGGCELALAMHLRIASDKALFGQPEVKLGVIPGYGGTQRLARLVGKGRAMDLCLTGRFIDAATAYQWGLVTEITTPETLLPRACELLTSIIRNGPLAVRAAMQTIDQGFDLPLPDALELEVLQFALTCASADKKEGTAAFLEKRPAKFKGK